MWDPAADTWTELPPMSHRRDNTSGCILADGRFAVVGGCFTDWGDDPDDATDEYNFPHEPREWGGGAVHLIFGDAEVFDPELNEWSALPDMPCEQNYHNAISVGGSMLVHGWRDDLLYDCGADQWFELPARLYDTTQARTTPVVLAPPSFSA